MLTLGILKKEALTATSLLTTSWSETNAIKSTAKITGIRIKICGGIYETNFFIFIYYYLKIMNAKQEPPHLTDCQNS